MPKSKRKTKKTKETVPAPATITFVSSPHPSPSAYVQRVLADMPSRTPTERILAGMPKGSE